MVKKRGGILLVGVVESIKSYEPRAMLVLADNNRLHTEHSAGVLPESALISCPVNLERYPDSGNYMTPTRTGITLTETLVTLAIIAILVAILLPAVQRVRESARNVTCQNNIRQMALAVHAHEAAHRALPKLYAGTFLQRPRTVEDEFHFHSWRTTILPQLEQSSLYSQIDFSTPATAVENQTNLNTSVSQFLCPSTSVKNEIVPDIYEFNDGALAANIIGTAARSDYEAIAGVIYDPNLANYTGVKLGPWGSIQYGGNLTPMSYEPGRFARVSDGLSNTILIGERAGRPDWYRHGQQVDPYPYSDSPYAIDHHQAAWGISTHIHWLFSRRDQKINDTNERGIYSFHNAGANVGLADGSVRFLPDTIQQKILNALITRSAGDIAATE